MRVADRLAKRETSWRELDALLDRLASQPARGVRVAEAVRLGELYRAACTDLMLAEAHVLPRDTVAYLHALVGRAHNEVYRAQGFRFGDWARALFETVPRQLRSDGALRLSALVFLGSFSLCMLLAAGRADFARVFLGEGVIQSLEQMYGTPLGETARDDTTMAGFYIQHNTSIGLQCFAFGLLFGLGSLYQLASNAMILGTMFGHMMTVPEAGNFYTFVTAHAPFELSAIILAGAAGLRLGYGLIETQGQTRLGSLRREASRALPTVGASVVLFILAAFLEGYVSASRLPYWVKAAIAITSIGLLAGYLALGGRARGAGRESERR